MAGCAEYFRIVETLVWRKTVIDHIGLEKFEYTDAIWVYWSRDLNQWDADNKAIVLDGKKSTCANRGFQSSFQSFTSCERVIKNETKRGN